jgi:hypothetical protein
MALTDDGDCNNVETNRKERKLVIAAYHFESSSTYRAICSKLRRLDAEQRKHILHSQSFNETALCSMGDICAS